jgi:hypothetical protein
MSNLNVWTNDVTLGNATGVGASGAPIILGNTLYIFGGVPSASTGPWANTIVSAPIASSSNSFFAYQLPQWVTDSSNNVGLTWPLTQNTTFTLAGQILGVATNTSATVSLLTPPTCTLTATPSAINVGQSSSLTYTFGGGSVTSASIDHGASSSLSLIPSPQSVSPIVNTTYTLTAVGPGGTGMCTTASSPSVTINSSLPTISSFSATKARKGGAATLSWTITGMNAGITCSIAPVLQAGQPVWNGQATWSGGPSSTPTINIPTKFMLSCGTGLSTTTASVQANLIPSVKEF